MMKYAWYPLSVEAHQKTKETMEEKSRNPGENKIHHNARTTESGSDIYTLTNYDDLMQTTIFHKVFLIMYS